MKARLYELDGLADASGAVDDELGDITLPEQKPHEPVWCGEIVFCTLCGAYAESKAVKLKGMCNGKPKFDGTYGGAWGQHRKLVNGRHPRSNDILPPPKRMDGSLWQPGVGKYTNLKATTAVEVDPKFYVYVPTPDKVLVPQVRVVPIQQLSEERMERIRKRQQEHAVLGEDNANNCKRRRLRSKGPAIRG